MKHIYLAIIGLVLSLPASGQQISATVPLLPDPDASYVFYLHGGIVNDENRNPTSSYYGKYEYDSILLALANSGFYVISEARLKETKEVDYAKKISKQVDSLLTAGIPLSQISVIGASLGAYIAMELAIIRKQEELKIALLGLCSEYALGYFKQYSNSICGDFLSVYEVSDQKGPCESIFTNQVCTKGFNEIRLDMGIDHAFLYKPYDEWLKPVVTWLKAKG